VSGVYTIVRKRCRQCGLTDENAWTEDGMVAYDKSRAITEWTDGPCESCGGKRSAEARHTLCPPMVLMPWEEELVVR
jgi:hypothetical protein